MQNVPYTDLRASRRGSPLPIEVYGTNWCAATQMVRRYLDRSGIPYIYHNMDVDPQAARQVEWWTGGFRSHPTIQIGGNILVEPSMDELRSALRQFRIV